MEEDDKIDIDFMVWQQEREFWMPRIAAVIGTNSLLFLGYVSINQTLLSIFLCSLAMVSNIFVWYAYSKMENKLNMLEERIKWKLPKEWNSPKATKGRSEFRPVIILFFVLWICALFYSIYVMYLSPVVTT